MRNYKHAHRIPYTFFCVCVAVAVVVSLSSFFRPHFTVYSLSALVFDFPNFTLSAYLFDIYCVYGITIEIHSDILAYEIIIHVFFIGNYFGFNVLKLRFKLFNNCCVHFDTFQSVLATIRYRFVFFQPSTI